MTDVDRTTSRQSAELRRLSDAREWDSPWRKWGPYLSERQWGTVREDYSQDGDAWQHFPHDHARSRAYHWGEDGLAGFSDLKQRLCFALTLWNGKDPILKERLFGLSNGEGNHGEDVKEYYFYLDSTPTHSYMKWLYKYPQAAFPYDDLVKTNAHRSRRDCEYELVDTGVFDDDRYFDVVVEYAKSSPEECFIRITVANRGPEAATIHLLPTLWFRNTWSWWPAAEKPHLKAATGSKSASVVSASHPELGERRLYCEGAPPLLFTENDTNTERLFDLPNASPYVKDAFHAFVVQGNTDAVNPAKVGTKAAAHYRLEVGAGQSAAVRLCLTRRAASPSVRCLREDDRGQASRGGRVLPMAMFCQNMFEIAVELAAHDPSYDELAYKCAEHFLWIGAAMNRVGHDGMWDEADGFYYDVLRLPDGRAGRLKVRSLVGLLPLCATTVIEPWQRERVPQVGKSLHKRFGHIPELLGGIHPTGPEHMNSAGRTMSALVDADRLRRILSRTLDEQEFLGPYGIRSLSRFHEHHPYVVQVAGKEYRVAYAPAESDSAMFGGNSNWRGPVWFPMNVLLIRALVQFYAYYGDSFRVDCPTGSGNLMTLFEVAKEISARLERIFLQDAGGRRPVFGGTEKSHNDPYWRDCIPFYEYFHGDNGAGLGASHQTGWTALVAVLAQIFATVDARTVFESGRDGLLGLHGSINRAHGRETQSP